MPVKYLELKIITCAKLHARLTILVTRQIIYVKNVIQIVLNALVNHNLIAFLALQILIFYKISVFKNAPDLIYRIIL